MRKQSYGYDFMDSYLTRRQVILLAGIVLVGPARSGTSLTADYRGQLVERDGWILRKNDLNPLESKRA